MFDIRNDNSNNSQQSTFSFSNPQGNNLIPNGQQPNSSFSFPNSSNNNYNNPPGQALFGSSSQNQPSSQSQSLFNIQPEQKHLNLGVNDYLKNINSNDVVRDQYGNIISYANSSYKSYNSMRDQMYDRPDMYIGSTSHDVRKTEMLNFSNPEQMFFYTQDCSIPQALKQIFKEILSNSADNILKSYQHNYKMSKYPLKVYMDRKSITVRNEGIPIPIEPSQNNPNLMKPEEIFGSFFQSQSYGNEIKSMAVARNGIGAKATSVFSKYFKIEIGSQGQGLKYEQTWENNMLVKNNYIITPYSGESYVQITYTADFQRFGYTEYPDDALNVYAKEVADACFAGRFYAKFNDININVKSVTDYARLLYGPILPNHIVHSEWPEGTELVTKKGKKVPTNPTIVPLVEMMFLDTPYSPRKFGFVNGLLNTHGGIHITSGYEAISKEIIEIMSQTKTRNKKGKKGKNNTKSATSSAPAKGSGANNKKRIPKIFTKDVAEHVSLIVSCRTYNPAFDAQTKTEFVSYKIGNREYTRLNIKLEDNIQNTLKHLFKETLTALHRELQAKKLNSLKSTDGRKGRMYVEKAQRANFAGQAKHIHETMLILVEGKSAKGWATMLIAQKKNGRDYWGSYPLKGKMLNSLNAGFDQILNNTEFNDIKKMLNLKEGLDYTIESNYRTLNYGKVAVATDADHDGKHIAALFYLFIASRFPSLLKVPGFINYIRTPIVRVKNKKEGNLKFYSIDAYEEWVNGPVNNRLDEKEAKRRREMITKYFKGLASAKKKDVQDDYANLRLVQMVCDYKTFESLKLAFDKTMADDRKFWMEAYQKVMGIEYMAHLSYTDFINYEFVQFALTNVGRSIPGIDGLKESLRKCVYASFQKWGAKAGERDAKQEKIAQLVGYIANITGYHYGENSLVMAIYAMNRRWAGTNNMSLFWPKSMLGTRNGEGEDSGQPRYTFTKMSPWIRQLFPKADEPLYKIIVDEGMDCEPELLLPIIPLSMINGVLGIGTGYSTFIPNFYPPALCEWIYNRLNKLPTFNLFPWYDKFNGVISVEYKKKMTSKKKIKFNDYDHILGGDLNLDGIDKDSVDFFYKPEKSGMIKNIDNTIRNNNEVDSIFNIMGETKVDTRSTTIFEFGSTIGSTTLNNGNITLAQGVTSLSQATTPSSDFEFTSQSSGINKEELAKIEKIKATYDCPTMSVVGRYRYVRNNDGTYDVEIVEIPITISFENYDSFLNRLVEEKKLNDFSNKSTEDIPHFFLYGLAFKPTAKSLRLRKNFGMTNMVLLDPDTGKPVKYKTTSDIIEHFFQWRYPYYVKRRDYQLKQKENRINELNNKKKFILSVINYNETKVQIDGTNVRIMNIKKDEIHRQMRALGLVDVEKLLKSVGSDKYAMESVDKMNNEIQKLIDDYNILYNTSVEQMWISDLNDFLDVYYKHYERLDGASKINGDIGFVKSEEEEEKKIKEANKKKKEAERQAKKGNTNNSTFEFANVSNIAGATTLGNNSNDTFNFTNNNRNNNNAVFSF